MRWRHLITTILLIPFLIIYLILGVTLVEFISGKNFILDIIIYCSVGLLWIPLTIPCINWLAKHES